MSHEKEITHIDLFSGIGAFTLAGEWAGFKTVIFCEKEDFCKKVLKKHWPEIPIIAEIRDFDGTKYQEATLLTGGFPCQPFSIAGQRRGKEDDRYLWPEMLRVINEAKPRWILAENVPGIFQMALDTVLADLEGKGYTTGTFIIPACGLNAPHRRNRVWIIGQSKSIRLQNGSKEPERISGWKGTPENADSHATDSRKQERNWLPSIGRKKMAEIGNENQNAQNTIRTRARNQDGKIDDQEGRIGQDRRKSIRQEDRAIGTSRPASTNKYAPDSQCLGRQKGTRKRIKYEKQIPKGQDIRDSYAERFTWQEDWYEVATRFCRVDDGVPDRIHRLKALGNAIVPQIAYEILKRIAWIENERAPD